MRLKKAISLIESFYILPLTAGVIGLVVSFGTFKNGALVIAVVLAIAAIAIAFLLKRKFINAYFKQCKYPYEFWSVLEKRDMTKDLQVTWAADLDQESYKQQTTTAQFLQDNKLSTRFVKSPNFFWPDVNNPVYIPQYVVAFEPAGLSLFGQSIAWQKIIDWNITGIQENSNGNMNIAITDGQGNSDTVIVDLDRVHIEPIDFLLLLAHFKIKNG